MRPPAPSPPPLLCHVPGEILFLLAAMTLALVTAASADLPKAPDSEPPGQPGSPLPPDFEEPFAQRLPSRPRVPATSATGRADALCQRADEAAWHGDGTTARRLYQGALRLVPEHPSALFGLGSLAASEGDVSAATDWFRHTTVADPEHRDAHFNLAVALIRQNQLTEATEVLERVLELDADDHPARRWLVQTLLRLGQRADDPEEGLAHYRHAAAIAPDETDAHLALANGLARQGHLESAVESYDRALALAPGLAAAHLGRATALLLDRRFAETRRALEQSLDQLGDERGDAARLGLRHALARLLASCPEAALRDGERALALALELFEQQPQPAFGETIAMAYAELGRFELAHHWQQRMVDAMVAGESAGEPLAEARRRLALYASGQPYRAP